jgi:hypothetical protein
MATVIDFYEASGEADDDILDCMPEVFIPPGHDEKFRGLVESRRSIDLGRESPFGTAIASCPTTWQCARWGAGATVSSRNARSARAQRHPQGRGGQARRSRQAVRRILPIMRFNNTPRVSGLKRLRRYRRKWNDALQTYTTPEHDENSHAADAFGEYAINCGIHPDPEPPEPKKINIKLPTLNDIVQEHLQNRRNSGNRI